MKSQDWELGYHEVPIHTCRVTVKIPLMRQREHAPTPIDSMVLEDLNRTSFRHRIVAYWNVFCCAIHRTHAESACDPPKEIPTIPTPLPNKDYINWRDERIKSNKTCEKLPITMLPPHKRRECFVDSSSSEEEMNAIDMLTEEDLRSHISTEILNDDSLFTSLIESRNLKKQSEDARANLQKYKKMSKNLWKLYKVTDREKLIPTHLTGRFGKMNYVKKNITDLTANREQLRKDTKENDIEVANMMMRRAILQQEMDEMYYEHEIKRLEKYNRAKGNTSFDDPSPKKKNDTHISNLWKKRYERLPPLPSVYERTYDKQYKMLERKLDYFQEEIDKHDEEIDYLLCGIPRPADEAYKPHFTNIYVPKYDHFTDAEKTSFLAKSQKILDAKKEAILREISNLIKLREKNTKDWQQGRAMDQPIESKITPVSDYTTVQDICNRKTAHENQHNAVDNIIASSETDSRSDVATDKSTVEAWNDNPIDLLPKLVQRPIAKIMTQPDDPDTVHEEKEEEEENNDIGLMKKLKRKTRIKVPYTSPADSEMHVEVNTTTPGSVAAEAGAVKKKRFSLKTPCCWKAVSVCFC